jgi:hypothetical protein
MGHLLVVRIVLVAYFDSDTVSTREHRLERIEGVEEMTHLVLSYHFSPDGHMGHLFVSDL